MVFSYQQVQEHPKLLLAMTSLTHAEFQQLLSHFQYAWDQYVQQHYVDRDERQRQYGAGRSEATLITFIGKYLSSFPILVGVSKFCIISEFKDWFESESRAPGALITSGMSPLSVYSQISDERFKGPTQPGSIAMAEGAKQLG